MQVYFLKKTGIKGLEPEEQEHLQMKQGQQDNSSH